LGAGFVVGPSIVTAAAGFTTFWNEVRKIPDRSDVDHLKPDPLMLLRYVPIPKASVLSFFQDATRYDGAQPWALEIAATGVAW